MSHGHLAQRVGGPTNPILSTRLAALDTRVEIYHTPSGQVPDFRGWPVLVSGGRARQAEATETMVQGTQDAWVEAVIQRNDCDLKRYLTQRVSSRADAEDLAQEIYLRLLRIERKDLIRSPEALLFRIAAHAVYEWRLLARNKLPHSESALDSLESPRGEPTTDLWQAELARALSDALEQLSPMCRAAVLLHRREQLTYSEVGQRLGISESMVKKYLSQGIALCRQHLQERLGLAAVQERG